MLEQALLTIAIPTYNRAHVVKLLAESVISQLLPGDELLVVDDCSTDATSNLLEGIADLRYYKQPSNQGMVQNWNSCLQLAKNDWVCIIHDDDILCPGALDALRKACSIASEPCLIMHQQTYKHVNSFFRYKIYSPGPSAVFCSASGTIPSGIVTHKEIVSAIGGFDTEFCYSADVEYFARINTKYKLLVIESPAIVVYQIHNDNYQYKTWLEPDFFPQLLEIERRVISYSGLKGAMASDLFNKRIVGYLEYILTQAKRLNNKTLMRKYGSLLWKSRSYGKRLRLRGLASTITSYLPFGQTTAPKLMS